MISHIPQPRLRADVKEEAAAACVVPRSFVWRVQRRSTPPQYAGRRGGAMSDVLCSLGFCGCIAQRPVRLRAGPPDAW